MTDKPKTSTPNLGGSGAAFAKASAADHASIADRMAMAEAAILAGGGVGVIGGTWFFGHGLPSDGLGHDDDLYLDIDTADVYAKENGTWL